MKQILRIRWRWFGHPAVPPPHSPPLGDYFAGRRTGGSSGDGASVSGCSSPGSAVVNPGAGGHGGLVASGSAGSNLCNGSGGNRKFTDPAGNRCGPGRTVLGATGNSCPRSFSQPECRSSSAALSWASPPPLRRSRPVTSMEPSCEAPVPPPPPPVHEPSAHVGFDEEAAAPAAPGTEDNNHPETDSSSCR